MYKFLGQGFEDFPTSLGPNGEVILNLARRELERIEQVPQNINVLILDYNYIRRLENLANLYDLRQLSVAGNKLFQMHGVAPLVNLTILNLPQNAIVAIDGLAKLTQLRWLNLSGNRLKSIEQLENNINLKHLDVSENYISQLTDISYLPRLKTLLLHCNRIQTLVDADRLLPRSLEIFSLASNLTVNISDVQYLSSLPNLVQFSLQNNPCTAFPPEEYEPLLLTYLPKLQILNGVNVEPETRARAEELKVKKFNSQPICINPTHEAEPDVPATSLPVLLSLHHEGSRTESPPIAKRSMEKNNNLSTNIQRVPSHEGYPVGVSGGHNQVDGDLSEVQPSEVLRARSSNPSQNEMSSSMNRGNYNEHNDLPAVSFRTYLEESSVATRESLEHHDSPTSQVSGSPAPPPMKSSSEATQHVAPLPEVQSNPAAASLLMSESVYLPVNTPIYPVRSTSPEPLSTSARSSKVKSQSHCSQLEHGADRPCTTSNANDTTPCQTPSVMADSLDVGRELNSTRTSIPSDQPIDLRGTLQSSFSIIPLTRSTESTEHPVTPHVPTAPSVNTGSTRTKQPHMIDNVYLINDEEEQEGDDQLSAVYPSQVVPTYAPQMSQSCHAGMLRSPMDQHVIHPTPSNYHETSPREARVNLNQLLLRSHPQPGEVVARSLDSWIQSSMFRSPTENTTKTRESDLRHPVPTRNSFELPSCQPIQQLHRSPKTTSSRHSNVRTLSRKHTSPLIMDNPSQEVFDSSSQKTITRPSDWSTVSRPSTSEGFCSSCGAQPRVLHDHIVFLRTQLQAQYKAAQAEAKLRQLHSKAIEFLLQEVQELKSWREQAMKQLSSYSDLTYHLRLLMTAIQLPESVGPTSTSLPSSGTLPSRSVSSATSARGDVPRPRNQVALRGRSPKQHATQQMINNERLNRGFPNVQSSRSPRKVQQEVIDVYDSDAEEIGVIAESNSSTSQHQALERPIYFTQPAVSALSSFSVPTTTHQPKSPETKQSGEASAQPGCDNPVGEPKSTGFEPDWPLVLPPEAVEDELSQHESGSSVEPDSLSEAAERSCRSLRATDLA